MSPSKSEIVIVTRYRKLFSRAVFRTSPGSSCFMSLLCLVSSLSRSYIRKIDDVLVLCAFDTLEIIVQCLMSFWVADY